MTDIGYSDLPKICTSVTVNAKHFLYARVNLLIVLRLTLLAGMDPPDMTVFFWNNFAASRRSDGRSGQFCAKVFTDKAKHLQTVYHDCTALHIGMARWKGLIFH